MRHAFALIALVSTLSAAAPVLAQSSDNARCAGASAADGSRDTTYCFGGEDVPGGVVGPNGQSSHVLRGMRGTSLLRIRAHFVPEMLKSVENL